MCIWDTHAQKWSFWETGDGILMLCTLINLIWTWISECFIVSFLLTTLFFTFFSPQMFPAQLWLNMLSPAVSGCSCNSCLTSRSSIILFFACIRMLKSAVITNDLVQSIMKFTGSLLESTARTEWDMVCSYWQYCQLSI